MKILVPIWGDRYIEQFLRLPLAALLSPGNLPAACKHADVEVVFLTAEKDIRAFSDHPRCRELEQLCATRFVDVTDLLLDNAGAYAYVLTYIYARGMIVFGEQMVDLHFLYLNADYVLADGSLSRLVQRLDRSDANFISGPSMRTTKERVEPILKSRMTRSGKLAIEPRDLAGLAIRYMHPTVKASILNQSLMHSSITNRLYWKVSDSTIVARFFLPLILCLRPERPLKYEDITSFIDYGFLPTLCPSGKWEVMENSDEFFLLELQEELTENWALFLGGIEPQRLARQIGRWCTREHRRFAQEFPLYIHAGNDPDRLPDYRARSLESVNDLISRLPSTPKSDVNHPYWKSLCRALSRKQSRFPFRGVRTLSHRAARWILGQSPHLRVWHPGYLFWRRVAATIRNLSADGHHEITLLFVNTAEEVWLRAALGEDLSRAVRFLKVEKNSGTPSADSAMAGSIGMIISLDWTVTLRKLRYWLKSMHGGEAYLFCQLPVPWTKPLALLDSEWWRLPATDQHPERTLRIIELDRIGDEMIGFQMGMWNTFRGKRLSTIQWLRSALPIPWLLVFTVFNNLREQLSLTLPFRGGLSVIHLCYEQSNTARTAPPKEMQGNRYPTGVKPLALRGNTARMSE